MLSSIANRVDAFLQRQRESSAMTNRVYSWKDGDRLFVELNGATIEARSLTFDRQIVTLQFHARVAALNSADGCEGGMGPHVYNDDPLLDECLW